MDIVVDVQGEQVVRFMSVPGSGAGGKKMVVGKVEDVGSTKSLSMLCKKNEKHSEYIIIQLGTQVVGVLPNTHQGKQVVNHNVVNYRSLQQPCIIHILPLGCHIPENYKRIRVL